MMTHSDLYKMYTDNDRKAATQSMFLSGQYDLSKVGGLDDIPVTEARKWLEAAVFWTRTIRAVEPPKGET